MESATLSQRVHLLLDLNARFSAILSQLILASLAQVMRYALAVLEDLHVHQGSTVLEEFASTAMLPT